MQTRRRFVKGGLALSAAVLAAGALPANAAGPVELAFSSWVPPTHVLMKDFMVPWGQQVEKATDGRVKIRFLPKPVTNPQGHRDAVRNGVADLAFISLSYYPGRFELMKFAMLPFSGKSAQSTSIAAWRMFDKYMHKMDDEGFLVLGLYAHGPGGVYTAKRKVEKIEDFKDPARLKTFLQRFTALWDVTQDPASGVDLAANGIAPIQPLSASGPQLVSIDPALLADLSRYKI